METEKITSGKYNVYSDDGRFIAEIEKVSYSYYWVASYVRKDWELEVFDSADTKKQLLEKLAENEEQILKRNAREREV